MLSINKNPFHEELIQLNAPKAMLKKAEHKGRIEFIQDCNNPYWLLWLAEKKQNNPGWISSKTFRRRFLLSITVTSILSLFFLKKLGKQLTVKMFKSALVNIPEHE